MTPEQKEAYRQSLIKHFANCNSCYFVTLRMKQSYMGKFVDFMSAPDNATYFYNILNSYIFGNNAKRNGRLINAVMNVEKDSAFHAHMIIEIPTLSGGKTFKEIMIGRMRKKNFKEEKIAAFENRFKHYSDDLFFQQLIKMAWKCTHFGKAIVHKDIHYRDVFNIDGSVDYLLKRNGKENLLYFGSN